MADAQASKSGASHTGDGETASGRLETPAFDTLLISLSSKGEANVPPSRVLFPDPGTTARLTNGTFGARQDADPQGADDDVPTETREGIPFPAVAGALASGEQFQIAPVGPILDSGVVLRPIQMQQTAQVTASQGALLDMIRLPSDESPADLPLLTTAPSKKAQVVHQEAHFKPVLTRLAPDAGVADNAEISSKETGTNPSIKKDQIAFPGIGYGAVPSNGGADPSERYSEPALLAGSAGEKGMSASSLVPSVLQRIAGAVIAEAEHGAPRQGVEISRPEVITTPSKIRLSEGIVRVLNIQLYPIELGLITVKMRLHGDKLEMELQASNVEAAELIKKDSEKLCELLRTSGYKPDVVAINAVGTDISQQDTPVGQRQSSSSLSQFSSPQQGDAGTDGRSRRQFEQSDAGQRTRSNSPEEIHGASRGASGVYL